MADKKIPVIEKEIKTKVKKEEKVLFHEFRFLERKHQVIFAITISAGVIFVWRGLWNLMDYYWFAGLPLISNLSGIIMGIIILYLSHRMIRQLAG